MSAQEEQSRVVFFVGRRTAKGRIVIQTLASASSAFNAGLATLSEFQEDIVAVAAFDIASDEAASQEIRQSLSGLLIELQEPGLYVTLPLLELVRHNAPSDIEFRDFGIFDLGAESRRDRLFVVSRPGLPLPSMPEESVAGNCPPLQKSFLGRESEIDALQSMILERRWTTIIGAPGSGRTSFAIRVGISVREDFKGGVWYVSVRDKTPSEIGDEIMRLVGAARHDQLEIPHFLTMLDGRQRLLIIDDMESDMDEQKEVLAHIFDTQPLTTFVCISAGKLGFRSEYVFDLPNLSLELDRKRRSHANLCDADRVFFERAGQAGVHLNRNDKPVVHEICTYVHGHAATIEMLAESLRSYPLQHLALICDENKALPTSLESRLKTLFSAWYQALSEDHRTLLKLLSKFTGNWDIPTLEALQLKTKWDRARFEQLHDDLVSRAWISIDHDNGTYYLLPPARIFLRSIPKGKEKEDFFFEERLSELALNRSEQLNGKTLKHAAAFLKRHYFDLLGMLNRSDVGELPYTALVNAHRALVPMWNRFNRLDDASRATKHILMYLKGPDKIRGLVGLGNVEGRLKRYEEAIKHFKHAVELARELQFDVGLAVALSNMGTIQCDAGLYEDAINSHLAVLELQKSSGDTRNMVAYISNAVYPLLISFDSEGDFDLSKITKAESLLAEARTYSTDDPFFEQALLNNEGLLHVVQGRFDRARDSYLECLRICATYGFEHEAFQTSISLAQIAERSSKPAEAAKLIGLSSRLLKEAGHNASFDDIAKVGTTTKHLSNVLGTVRFRKYFDLGSKMSLKVARKMIGSIEL